eukprot:TRINITY_DN1618_c0_g1_i2.p1 TRINITY_DN1618_c0_g1~~TRINITY_DN1618_c0_g1_i2.p1  ORF type:complete len:748 (+),score=193.07 TRINITY_DN1618_c0_g1_i2:95-2338(+)
MSAKKGQEALLLWCKRATEGYNGVNVTNFHTSWADGLAFCALIHHFRPELIPFKELKAENKAHNLGLAFKVAESIGIPALLDVEDMIDIPKPEQFSVITYLSQFYHTFKNAQAGQSAPGGKRKSIETPEGKKPVEQDDMCVKCGKELEGPVIEVMNKNYHEACFGCFDCGKRLVGKCLNVDGNPFCENCGRKAFIQSKKPKTETSSGASSAPPPATNNTAPPATSNTATTATAAAKPPLPSKTSAPSMSGASFISGGGAFTSGKTETSTSAAPSLPSKVQTQPPAEKKASAAPILPPKSQTTPQENTTTKQLPTPVKKPPTLSPKPNEPSTNNSPAKPPENNNNTAPPSEPDKPKSDVSTPEEKTEPTSTRPKAKPPVPNKPVTLRGDSLTAIDKPAKNVPNLPAKPSHQQQTLSTSGQTSPREDDDGPPARKPPTPPKETTSPRQGEVSPRQNDKEPELVAVKMSMRVSAMPNNDSAHFESSDLPNLEGYLEKKGDAGVIKGWKKRYCKLVQDRLIYYADQNAKDQGNPIGYIPLRSAISIEPWTEQGRPKAGSFLQKGLEKGNSFLDSLSSTAGAFQITTTDPSRIWYLKASSPEEMQRWRNACILHSKYSETAKPKNNLNPLAMMAPREGHLEKLAGGVSGKVVSLRKGPVWRQRWFVLKDGILFKYESKTDLKPAKIPLYKCNLEEYRNESQQDEISTQFQITTRQKTITLKAPNEEEMHLWLNAILKQKLVVEQIIDGIEIL